MLDAVPFSGHRSGLQPLCVHLSAGIQRNLLHQHALAGQIGLRQLSVLDEHLDQCITHNA